MFYFAVCVEKSAGGLYELFLGSWFIEVEMTNGTHLFSMNDTDHFCHHKNKL